MNIGRLSIGLLLPAATATILLLVTPPAEAQAGRSGNAPGQSGESGRLQSPPLDKQKAMSMKIPGTFTFVAAGDLIDIHPIARRDDPDIQAALNVVRGADAAAANMEANIADRRHYDGAISDHTGDSDVAADVKSMGFEIVNRANNHTTDEGTGILFETQRNLDAQGIVYAGSGRNLAEARAARFVELPKGRVGMVGVLSTGINGGSEAATYGIAGEPGLPGANILHLNTYHVLPGDQLDELRKMRDDAYTHRTEVTYPVPPLPANEPKDTLNFWGTLYKAGNVPGGLSYTMNAEDERDILRSIRNGKELSDFMAVVIHTHEDTSLLQTLFLSEHPADFLVMFAHDAIDNGADLFIGTGPHVLRGVEIYHGKPIFYGLAQFVYQLSTGEPGLSNYTSHGVDPFRTDYTGAELDYDQGANRLALPVNYDSVFAECRYENGELTQVILHPLDEGYDLPQSQRGAPRVAHGASAQRILKQLQTLSQPFGTQISIEGELGVIHVAKVEESRK
jgi:hypothetical protein